MHFTLQFVILDCYGLFQSSCECLSHKSVKAIAPQMALISMQLDFLIVGLANRGAFGAILFG